MTLPYAQELYAAYERLSSLVINVENSNLLGKTKKDISSVLDEEVYEIMDWKEMNPELVQQIQSDAASGYIMLGMLYLIIGFGGGSESTVNPKLLSGSMTRASPSLAAVTESV